MRPSRRSLEQLHLLGHQQRPELRGEALNKILVRVHRCPMRAAVVVEPPEMDKLIDRAGVGLEIADELLPARPSEAPESQVPGRASVRRPADACLRTRRARLHRDLMNRSALLQPSLLVVRRDDDLRPDYAAAAATAPGMRFGSGVSRTATAATIAARTPKAPSA